MIKLEKENSLLKNQENQTQIKKKQIEDEELAKALEQIKEMEGKQQINRSASLRNNNLQMNNFRHPIEIPFDPSDIIDLGAMSFNPSKNSLIYFSFPQQLHTSRI